MIQPIPTIFDGAPVAGHQGSPCAGAPRPRVLQDTRLIAMLDCRSR